MKKLTLTILILGLLSGCNSPDKPKSFTNAFITPIKPESPVEYYKDTITKLCFAVYRGEFRTFTCIPCDSLKKVKVKVLE